MKISMNTQHFTCTQPDGNEFDVDFDAYESEHDDVYELWVDHINDALLKAELPFTVIKRLHNPDDNTNDIFLEGSEEDFEKLILKFFDNPLTSDWLGEDYNPSTLVWCEDYDSIDKVKKIYENNKDSIDSEECIPIIAMALNYYLWEEVDNFEWGDNFADYVWNEIITPNRNDEDGDDDCED
jgi:hypothetical protein